MQPVALSLWFVSLSAMRKRNEQDAARPAMRKRNEQDAARPAMQKRNKQHAARRNALKKTII
jgi:hypothetical protein